MGYDLTNRGTPNYGWPAPVTSMVNGCLRYKTVEVRYPITTPFSCLCLFVIILHNYARHISF